MEPHETAAEAEVGAKRGFTCHKLKARPWNIVETVELIKAAAGPDYTVGIDPNQKFRLVHIAARLARELEPFGTVANFENPVLKTHLDWFRLLREKTHIPIALHANSATQVLAALKAECIDYVNLSGSALEIKKAAALAEAADVPCWVQIGWSLPGGQDSLPSTPTIDNSQRDAVLRRIALYPRGRRAGGGSGA